MSIHIPPYVNKIARTLVDAGAQTFLVGGAVRDALLGHTPKDYDLATDLHPDAATALCERAGYHVVPSGLKHGTVVVTIPDPVTGALSPDVDVTTMRTDGQYSDGRRPDRVQFTDNIFDDLRRRDFTVNAMAYNVQTGELLDPHHGQHDLELKVLRTVGYPDDRFGEDGLRVMRAMRLATTKGFVLSLGIGELLQFDLTTASRYLSRIAVERVRAELDMILESPRAAYGLRLLMEHHVMPAILPEVQRLHRNDQRSPWHAHDTWQHTLAVVAATPPSLPLRWAALLHDIGKPAARGARVAGGSCHYHGHEDVSATMTRVILQRLKCSNELTDHVVELVGGHMMALTPEHHDRVFRRALSRHGRVRLEELVHLRCADRLGTGTTTLDEATGERDALLARIGTIADDPVTVVQPSGLAINGKVLMRELGLPQGKPIGILLRALFDLVLDDPAMNTESRLLEAARAAAFGVDYLTDPRARC